MESNIRPPVLLNLLSSLRKRDKMLGKPRILSLSPTCLMNSIEHEHSLQAFLLQAFAHMRYVSTFLGLVQINHMNLS